jgi:signal transduction histidine kinase/CheY-like chemotaxis protein
MTEPEDHQVGILLVDDQQAELAALEATLERLGQRLVRARSGREALRILLQQDFAVILLDVMMPETDGFETAKLIRERGRSSRTPIIFLTGLQQGELPLFQAYALGAVDYLLKPFEPDILRSKVSVFVDLALKTEQVRRSAEALGEAQRRQHEQDLQEERRKFETERLRAQRETLREQMDASLEQRRWLEAILEAMPTPLALLDPVERQMVFANRAARSLAGGALIEWGPPKPGLTVSDAHGRRLVEGELPADRAMRGEQLGGVQVNFSGPGAVGSLLAYSDRLGAMHGHPETVLLTLLDVSDLKKVEADLKAAVRNREDFLAVASHELLTPLTALRFEVANAIRSWNRADAARAPREHAIDYLRTMERSIGRLTRLSNYLLDVSRIEAGKLLLERSAFDLGELVREVVRRYQDELLGAGCTATVIAEEPVVGRWDKTRLDQTVTNLLTNAIKYAPGKPIELELKSTEQTVSLVVRDHGDGIAPARRERIFRKFERSAEPSDGQGFGLGLWIVHQIVSRHGGTVEAVSESGVGTVFTVVLPREAAEADPRARLGSRPTPTPTPSL